MLPLDDYIDSQNTLQRAAEARLTLLLKFLNKVTHRIVQSGPFVGMKLATLPAQKIANRDSTYRNVLVSLLVTLEHFKIA